ncbi:MAG: hypothetical protein XD87_0336 [candidate division WS6 bacterium 36_33]|uniref:Uncharacterized protein n=1 Tax=candidate division WS6 bacterium 36_33 TaxID=1641388 RepID=A0A101GYY2_9BACT|nr:MAG: hypothetical protein XD87_0336 [candidate division WS6 bacterium 36_33]
MSIESISFEEAISRKSDRLCDYDRNIRLFQIEEHVEELVEDTCGSYRDDTLVIPNCEEGGDIKDVYLSRSGGIYEIGINHYFFREFITFKDIQNNDISFEVVPKYRKASKMLYDYTKHPNITFDALVRILAVVYEVVQKDKLMRFKEE